MQIFMLGLQMGPARSSQYHGTHSARGTITMGVLMAHSCGGIQMAPAFGFSSTMVPL